MSNQKYKDLKVVNPSDNATARLFPHQSLVIKIDSPKDYGIKDDASWNIVVSGHCLKQVSKITFSDKSVEIRIEQIDVNPLWSKLSTHLLGNVEFYVKKIGVDEDDFNCVASIFVFLNCETYKFGDTITVIQYNDLEDLLVKFEPRQYLEIVLSSNVDDPVEWVDFVLPDCDGIGLKKISSYQISGSEEVTLDQDTIAIKKRINVGDPKITETHLLFTLDDVSYNKIISNTEYGCKDFNKITILGKTRGGFTKEVHLLVCLNFRGRVKNREKKRKKTIIVPRSLSLLDEFVSKRSERNWDGKLCNLINPDVFESVFLDFQDTLKVRIANPATLFGLDEKKYGKCKWIAKYKPSLMYADCHDGVQVKDGHTVHFTGGFHQNFLISIKNFNTYGVLEKSLGSVVLSCPELVDHVAYVSRTISFCYKNKTKNHQVHPVCKNNSKKNQKDSKQDLLGYSKVEILEVTSQELIPSTLANDYNELLKIPFKPPYSAHSQPCEECNIYFSWNNLEWWNGKFLCAKCFKKSCANNPDPILSLPPATIKKQKSCSTPISVGTSRGEADFVIYNPIDKSNILVRKGQVFKFNLPMSEECVGDSKYYVSWTINCVSNNPHFNIWTSSSRVISDTTTKQTRQLVEFFIVITPNAPKVFQKQTIGVIRLQNGDHEVRVIGVTLEYDEKDSRQKLSYYKDYFRSLAGSKSVSYGKQQKVISSFVKGRTTIIDPVSDVHIPFDKENYEFEILINSTGMNKESVAKNWNVSTNRIGCGSLRCLDESVYQLTNGGYLKRYLFRIKDFDIVTRVQIHLLNDEEFICKINLFHRTLDDTNITQIQPIPFIDENVACLDNWCYGDTVLIDPKSYFHIKLPDYSQFCEFFDKHEWSIKVVPHTLPDAVLGALGSAISKDVDKNNPFNFDGLLSTTEQYLKAYVIQALEDRQPHIYQILEAMKSLYGKGKFVLADIIFEKNIEDKMVLSKRISLELDMDQISESGDDDTDDDIVEFIDPQDGVMLCIHEGDKFAVKIPIEWIMSSDGESSYAIDYSVERAPAGLKIESETSNSTFYIFRFESLIGFGNFKGDLVFKRTDGIRRKIIVSSRRKNEYIKSL